MMKTFKDAGGDVKNAIKNASMDDLEERDELEDNEESPTDGSNEDKDNLGSTLSSDKL
jgi:hypothetical protein